MVLPLLILGDVMDLYLRKYLNTYVGIQAGRCTEDAQHLPRYHMYHLHPLKMLNLCVNSFILSTSFHS